MEAKGEKVVVVANIVDEAPSKLAVAGSPELAALNNGLTNEANALKGAATLLFCLSLFQVFTLHGARARGGAVLRTAHFGLALAHDPMTRLAATSVAHVLAGLRGRRPPLRPSLGFLGLVASALVLLYSERWALPLHRSPRARPPARPRHPPLPPNPSQLPPRHRPRRPLHPLPLRRDGDLLGGRACGGDDRVGGGRA